MLNGRLYRAAFVPVVIALAIAAFSLQRLPAPLGSTLAPEAFEGAPATAQLDTLARAFPQRRPGSAGDERMAGYVAQQISSLGGTAGGGFAVHSYRFSAQTIDGERTLTNVVAIRPGSTDEAPILILAHRDSAQSGARGELSATAALLELARVFSDRETRRTIVLASTSGGSGGSEGAARLSAELHAPLDAAVVLGDLAGKKTRQPLVVPYSDSLGSAPALLQGTLTAAISQQAGIAAGSPGALAQLAHLVFPLSVGEQAVLQARGTPAVLVQSSSEAPPGAREAVSSERLEGLGRAVLSAVDALDTAPNVPTAAQTGIVVNHQELPSWALSLIVLALILPAAFAGIDGLARLRRRGVSVAHWAGWSLSCAAPFFACALFAYILGFLGVLGGAPGAPAPARATPFGATAAIALALEALGFVLAWIGWGSLVRRLRWGTRPDPDAAGIATVLLATAVAVAAWIENPFSALLIVPALHVLLALSTPQLRPRRALGSLCLLALAALPLALIALYYANALDAGPGAVAWGALLLLAGGYIGPASALAWSLALGCAAAALIAVVGEEINPEEPAAGEPREIRFMIRGPLTYAGPGSLGGTESALHR
jgi:hypothetical protein